MQETNILLRYCIIKEISISHWIVKGASPYCDWRKAGNCGTNFNIDEHMTST